MNYTKKQLKQYDLVEVKQLDQSIIIDLRYATKDNFTKCAVYPENAEAYLRYPVAQALTQVNQILKQQQLCLKIWDAYRPFEAQEKFWQLVPDERYIAKPVKQDNKIVAGSRHCKGTAVDVTLVNLNDNKEVQMPSIFDDFSEKSHRKNYSLNQEAIKNRDFLENIMEKQGFIGWPMEWWHFDWREEATYDFCDLPIGAT